MCRLCAISRIEHVKPLSLTITTTARFIGIKEAAFSLLIVTVTPTTGVTGYWTRLSLSGNLETIVGDGVNYVIASPGNLIIMKFKSSEQGLYVFNATDDRTARSFI
jgi:hypothetical protein